MVNKFVIFTFLSTLFFSGFYYKVIAEDIGVCFMVTSSGKIINLDKLCGVTIPDKKNTHIPSINKTSKNESSQISSIVKVISKSKITKIPIKRRIGKTPVIEVNFNNKQTFEMILDTGANSTLITLKMADKLQLKATGNMEAQVADGSQIKFSTSEVKYIAVGEIIAKNIEVVIAPNADIGLLGQDFFSEYDIKLLATEVEFHRR